MSRSTRAPLGVAHSGRDGDVTAAAAKDLVDIIAKKDDSVTADETDKSESPKLPRSEMMWTCSLQLQQGQSWIFELVKYVSRFVNNLVAKQLKPRAEFLDIRS